MEEKIKLEITEKQYDALQEIRGLKNDGHMMVMTAKRLENGWLLEGTEKTFDRLVTDLYDEVEFEMQPKSKLKHLRQLICEISPEGDF